MENESNESGNDTKLCKICLKETQRYLCPRCGIKYCSVVCYKSEAHSECSESFYKECVEEELKLDEKDPETRKKMLEILKRMHDEQEEDDQDIEELANQGLDSDDDDQVPDLSERLKDVNLEDADSVWAALTDSEKQEFESLLRNGDMEKLLPTWKPWWSYRAENKLVQDLSKTGESIDYRKNCPRVRDVKPYDQISRVPPAECVKNNVLNVLHAYAFTTLYFNGDHHDFGSEAASIFLQLCNNLRENEVFADSDLAIESVCQQAMNSRSLVSDSANLAAMKEASIQILRGPEDSNKFFYLKAALFDALELLSEAKTLSKKKDQAKSTNNEFTKRFPDHGAISTDQIPRDKLRLYSKKIEYYLSWVETYGLRDLYS